MVNEHIEAGGPPRSPGFYAGFYFYQEIITMIIQSIVKPEVNRKHLHQPERGDLWSEHVAIAVLLVLNVTETHVDVLLPYRDDDGMGYDTSQGYKRLTREEFVNKLTYSSDRNKTWCDVHPHQQKVLASLFPTPEAIDQFLKEQRHETIAS